MQGIRTGPNFSGTVRVTDGRFRYHTKENNIGGTYTLREGDGKRVLELSNDPHTLKAKVLLRLGSRAESPATSLGGSSVNGAQPAPRTCRLELI